MCQTARAGGVQGDSGTAGLHSFTEAGMYKHLLVRQPTHLALLLVYRT
jgi:hypothetical protein